MYEETRMDIIGSPAAGMGFAWQSRGQPVTELTVAAFQPCVDNSPERTAPAPNKKVMSAHAITKKNVFGVKCAVSDVFVSKNCVSGFSPNRATL